METKITTQSDTQAVFTVTLNEEHLKHAVEHVYDELRPRVKAAGFRPGKAPNHIVERDLGSSTVQGEIIEHAVQDTYTEALRQTKLQVVSSPDISLEKFVPYTELEYKATVTLLPKVELPDYKSFRIDKSPAKVKPAEVEAALEDLRRREAVRSEVTRAAGKTDEVNFDFDGTKDGEPVRGASAKGQTLKLDSGQFIPGFEDELIGLMPGEDKTFDIRFPDTYHEDTLAGQVVTFAVHINKITELVLPSVDNEFAAKIGPFTTVDELKEDLLQQQTTQKLENSTREYEQKVIDKLLDETNFAAPEVLVTQQLERLKSELEQNLGYSGLTYDKYVELSGKTAEEMESEMRPEAEKRVRMAMILTEVASQEGIKLSPDDLDTEIANLKGQYQDEATQKELDNPQTREEIYNHLMASKVIAALVAYAQTSK